MNLELRAENAPWRAGVDFLAKDGNAVGQPITMDIPIEGITCSPTFSLSVKAAQILIDDLWNCGLRPTEGTGSAGSLAATEKHLNDMRKLVSKKFNVDL